MRNQKLKIVGVVKDFNLLSPEVTIPPMTFYHLKTLDVASEMSHVYVKLKSDNIENTRADIEKLWVKVDTEYPFKYDFVENNMRERTSRT